MAADVSAQQRSAQVLRLAQVLILIFMIGAVIGFVYEELFYRINDGEWSKRGSTFGPWVSIYGFGALLILAVTHKVRTRPLPVFVLSCIVTGALEFAVGWYLWTFQGIRLWDYNTEIWNWGNVGGYICARSYLLFGAMGVVLQLWIRPAVERFADRVRPRTLAIVSFTLGGVYLLDVVLAAVLR